MKKYMPIALAGALIFASASAHAQTTETPSVTPPPASDTDAAPAATPEAPAAAPETPAPAATPASPAPSTTAETPAAAPPASSDTSLVLTDAQAEAWIDKPVYSSDNKNMGEVAEVSRDPSGAVTELHADLGGFFGFGETRVRLMPSDFKWVSDKVVLNMTAEQAEKLPPMTK